jgi:hypothetical protein
MQEIDHGPRPPKSRGQAPSVTPLGAEHCRALTVQVAPLKGGVERVEKGKCNCR